MWIIIIIIITADVLQFHKLLQNYSKIPIMR